MDLSGFAVFDFSEGIPYFSVTSNGVTFNRAVYSETWNPGVCATSYQRVDPASCIAGFVTKVPPKAVAFYKPKTNGVLSVRWNAQDLVATFKRLMESDLQHGFRVNGELVENGLMVFDLNTAKALV